MNIRIYQSSKGDCLLIEGSNGGRVLCDGGMSSSMRDHVRESLSRLDGIDAVYVSHIDQDHISGVLALLQDLLAWKVFRHHDARGDGDVRRPTVPEPPVVGGIWHNAFHHLITRNRGAIEDLLAAAAPALHGTGLAEMTQAGDEMENIANSIPEAMEVSALIQPELLNIPLNRPPGRSGAGELLLIEEPNDPFRIGSMSFQLIGPSKKQLRRLRKGWDNWLRENRDRVTEIRREIARRVSEFASGSLDGMPFDLGDWNGVPDFEDVTVPNTASLMFLVEDAGRTVLLTGDSHHDLVLEGLEDTGNLRPGHIHVDVLKVQHHGSEHNVDRNFCRRVSADHYVFCGNGSSGNPEREVLQMFCESRIGPGPNRALAPEAEGRPFHFWFSTTAAHQPRGSRDRQSFEQTERIVDELRQGSNGRLEVHFNERDFIDLQL
jgi:glyoxylase-like metal-dependent hydrolase (beta-lactamase superfamily II)